ncbi:MAG: hypothetical protein RMK65_11915, partial [Anaerolineae bacterium]|nr:hypothetical protein [Anaerolineae bacterium]
NPETMERLPRLDAQERFAGLEATFDAGIVQPSLASPSAAVSPCHDVAPIEQRGFAAVRLLSWAPLASSLRSGERFTLELCWLSTEHTKQLGTTPIVVQLRNAQALHWLYRGSPAMGALPFSQWRANMLVRDRMSLRLPFDLPSGQYQLAVQVGEHGVADLGSMQVAAVPRRYDLPLPEHAVHAELGEQLELIGFDLEPVSQQYACVCIGAPCVRRKRTTRFLST